MARAPKTEKQCRLCGVVKPISEFHTQKNRKGYTCVHYCCKSCGAEAVKRLYHSNPKVREKVKARSAQWARDNPERIKHIRRRVDLKAKYGLTEADYQAMLTEQSGRCAICLSEDSGRTAHKWADGRFHIDHCHETARVRGLLCHTCNVRLGAYERLMKDRGHDWLQAYLAG